MWEVDSSGYQGLSLPMQQQQKKKAEEGGCLSDEQPKRSERMVVQEWVKETECGTRGMSRSRR